MRAALWFLPLAIACGMLAWLLHGGSVRFAQGLVLESTTMTREVAPGGTVTLTIRYRADHALDANYWVFVHLDAEVGGVDAAHQSGDAAPVTPATAWGAQEIVHTVRIPVDGRDKPGRYAVYTGLYDRASGRRLHVLDPPSGDDRILLGTIDVVPENADGSDRTVTGPEIHARTQLELWRLWAPWLIPIGVTSAVAALVLRRRRAEASTDVDHEATASDRLSRAVRFLVLAVPAVVFFLGILVVLEFVKDDAYISFRYAHNLVTGQGLVFNHGERVEGFTNFLWVFVLAPFEALGWDLFQVCEVLGTALGVACLVVTGRITAWINGDRRMLTQMWGALWLATSASFVLWAKSGLEQPLVSLLPIAGAFVLWRARGKTSNERRYLAAGLIMGAGAMTRPELHLMAILVGLPLVADAIRARRVRRAEWLYVAGILAVTAPCHAFRLLYYGTLVPNTFYAKTASGWIVWHEGIKTVADMFAFNHTGFLAVAAPLAFANRKRLLEKATMAVVVVAFLAFYASVGVDEMQWHRLFLPALPFLCVLAALGTQNLLDAVVNVLERRGPVPAARTVAWCAGWPPWCSPAGRTSSSPTGR